MNGIAKRNSSQPSILSRSTRRWVTVAADQPVRLPALHPLELTDGTDVDEHGRASQPVVEHGNQALAPGERSRLLAVLGQHSQSLVEGPRPAVQERGWLHALAAISRP